MVFTTTKFIACLAVVSTVAYEISGENADPNKENTLSATHGAGPEMQTASTAFAKADEERASPLRIMPRPPHALRFPTALNTNQVHVAKDLQQALTSTIVEKPIFGGARLVPRRQNNVYADFYKMLKIAWSQIELGYSPDGIKASFKNWRDLSDEHKKMVDDVVDKVFSIYDRKLQEKANKLWNKRKDPNDIRARLGGSGLAAEYAKHYKDTFRKRENYMRLKYAEWYSKGTPPEDVKNNLEQEFPGEAQLVSMYYEDYKTLFEGYTGNMAKLKPWFKPERTTKYTLQAFVKMQKATTDWWRQGKSPDEVKRLLSEDPASKEFARKVFEDYDNAFAGFEFRMRSKYYNWFSEGTNAATLEKILQEEYPGDGQMLVRYLAEYKMLYEGPPGTMEKLREWFLETKHPNFVDNQLKRQNAKGTLSDGMTTLLRVVYRIWWNENSNTSGWKLSGKTPADVFASLKLDTLSGQTPQNLKVYREFVDWWIITYPEKAVAQWKQLKKTPDELYYLLELHLPNNSEIARKKLSCFNEYNDWWIDMHLDDYVAEWMALATPPEEVFVFLAFSSATNLKDSVEKRNHYLKQYCDWWDEAHPE